MKCIQSKGQRMFAVLALLLAVFFLLTLKAAAWSGSKTLDEESTFPVALKADPALEGRCCIKGIYDGTHQDIKSTSCPEPVKETFVLYVDQGEDCGSRVKGKVVDAHGAPMRFLGSVKPGLGDCCRLEGQASRGSEMTKLKATLCPSIRKWRSDDGQYSSSSGCDGKFILKQR